ncbi:tetratricopeptide repeat protein [Chloroflexota bacterium]
MNTIEQKPLEILLRFMLRKQPNSIRESMVNISVLTWFNLEILENTATEYILDGQFESAFRDILKLGLTQPFQELGYSYHDEIRRILGDYLKEEPERMIDVYQRATNYLRSQVATTNAISINTLRRELANRLVDLGRIYLQELHIDSARDVYLEAVDIFVELDNVSMAEGLLIELGKTLADEHDWAYADKIYQKLMNPETFNRFVARESVQREVANYCFEKAEWHAGQQKWVEAFDLYRQAKELYGRMGDLVSVNKMISLIQRLEQDTNISSSQPSLSIEDIPISPPSDNENPEELDEIDMELKDIEAKMRLAWIPTTQS